VSAGAWPGKLITCYRPMGRLVERIDDSTFSAGTHVIRSLMASECQSIGAGP